MDINLFFICLLSFIFLIIYKRIVMLKFQRKTTAKHEQKSKWDGEKAQNEYL